jgi:hypothetical protein
MCGFSRIFTIFPAERHVNIDRLTSETVIHFRATPRGVSGRQDGANVSVLLVTQCEVACITYPTIELKILKVYTVH